MKQPPGTGFLYGVWAAATTVFTVGEAAATPTLVRPTVTGMGPETECDDYFDNDGDGLVDGADSDCAGKVAEQCANFRDDNADGHIDCADTSGPSPCSSLLQCQNGGLCKSATAITCGAAPLTGTTVGAGTRIDTYACDGAYETGPEAYVAFTTSASKMVTVQLSGYSGDLDLVILGTGNNPSACDPFAACIGASSTTNATESVTFSAAAGETYYFAVDGYAGASSTFTLGVTCN